MSQFCEICEHSFDDSLDDRYRCLICGQECCDKCIDLGWMICKECDSTRNPSHLEITPIDWRPYEELVITPEMENWELLLYVEQTKLCSLKVPRVITADIIDGKVRVCYSHRLIEKDWTLSKITHYAWLNDPE